MTPVQKLIPLAYITSPAVPVTLQNRFYILSAKYPGLLDDTRHLSMLIAHDEDNVGIPIRVLRVNSTHLAAKHLIRECLNLV